MISCSPNLTAFNLKSKDCMLCFTIKLLYRDLRHMTLLSPRCLECVAGYVKMVKSPRNEKCYNVPETFQLFNKPPPTPQGFIRDIVFINIEFLKMCPGCLQTKRCTLFFDFQRQKKAKSELKR